MACQITFCTGKKGEEPDSFSGLAPEMKALSELLKKRFGKESLNEESFDPGWPSPLRISCFDRMTCDGEDWAVMSRTRRVSDAERNGDGFVTEFVVCSPDEVRKLSQLRITPADVLLAPGRSGLWFEGARWQAPIGNLKPRPIPLVDAVNPERNRVSPRRIEPSFWSQLAPKKNGSAPLHPFQYPGCCWLADRNREVTVRGSGDTSMEVALDPDGLLILFNESSRAMAEEGEEKHSGLRVDWWSEVPWNLPFATYALDRERSDGRRWIGCWQGVPRHEGIVSEARAKKNLLDLDQLGKFKPERLETAGWIPKERVIRPARPEGKERPEPEETEEPEERPRKSFFRMAAAAILGLAVLAVLAVFVGDFFATRGSEENRKVAAIQAYSEELDAVIHECDAALEAGESADYGTLAEHAGLLENLVNGEYEKSEWLVPHTNTLWELVINEEDGHITVKTGESENSRKVEAATAELEGKLNLANGCIHEYTRTREDAGKWRDRLNEWSLEAPIDPGSVPESLGRNQRANDQRGIRATLEVANRIAGAKSPDDLPLKDGMDWRTEMQNAKEATGLYFKAALASVEQKAAEIMQENLLAWKPQEDPKPKLPNTKPDLPKDPKPGWIPGESGITASLVLPHQNGGGAVVCDLPLPEGSELKWVRYVEEIDGEKLSLHETVTQGSESVSVSIPSGNDPEQSWEPLECIPDTNIVLCRSSRERVGDLERTGGGSCRFAMAPENFKSDYAILVTVPEDQPEASRGRYFFVCKSSPLTFTSVPADRFFREGEEDPAAGRLRIDLGARAHRWEVEGSVGGSSLKKSIPRLADIRQCFEDMAQAGKSQKAQEEQLKESAADFASAVQQFKEFFLSEEPNRISGTGWEGEPDLFSGVRRFNLRKREVQIEDGSGRTKSKTVPFLEFAGSPLKPLTYTFRDYFFGKREPLEGVRRKENFSTFREALWSYGELSLGKFIKYSSIEADYGGGTPNEEMTNLFHNPESEKDAFEKQYRQIVEIPLDFGLFERFFPEQEIFPGMDGFEKETARVQNRLRFQHQWREFARRLNHPQIQRFFEWESMATGENGPAIQDPIEHFDRFFASGSPPPMPPPGSISTVPVAELEAALKNPGPQLNELVKITSLQLFVDD